MLLVGVGEVYKGIGFYIVFYVFFIILDSNSFWVLVLLSFFIY